MEGQSEASITSNQYTSNYDKLTQSRRSVDWRDSGIVIDEDHTHFSSYEPIFDHSSRSSLSTASIHHEIPSAIETPAYCPIQKIAYDQDVDGDTILHLAVVGFPLNKVKDLVKICDLDAINNMMQTPMHVAVLANRPEMVELLISTGARVDVHDRRGNTPLHLACQKGHKEIVEIILDSDKQNQLQRIEMANFDGQTCLHLASTNEQRQILELLVIKYNTDINCKDSKSGETIMHKAICKFNIDLVAFILRLPKHCNIRDFSGRTPLETIRILRDSRANESQMDVLDVINRLVLNSIESCPMDCCKGYKQQIANNELILDSSETSSCSSSDCSDSDYEMN